MSVRIEYDMTRMRKKLGKLKHIEQPIKRQIDDWSSETVRRTKMNIRDIFTTRTGQLWRSVGFKSGIFGNIIRSEIGSGAGGAEPTKYARILEKGGKIRPKRAKALTIPLPGVKGRAANYPNSFIIKSKKGNVLIAQRAGKKGLRPLFVLKKKVKIPAFHWLSAPVKVMRPKLNKMLSPKEILKVMGGMK